MNPKLAEVVAYLKRGKSKPAIALIEKHGLHENEIAAYLKRGKSKPAIALIEKHGLHEKGAELLERGGWPGPAGDHYLRAANLEASKAKIDHDKYRRLLAKAGTAYTNAGLGGQAEDVVKRLRILASR